MIFRFNLYQFFCNWNDLEMIYHLPPFTEDVISFLNRIIYCIPYWACACLAFLSQLHKWKWCCTHENDNQIINYVKRSFERGSKLFSSLKTIKFLILWRWIKYTKCFTHYQCEITRRITKYYSCIMLLIE